MSDSSVEYVWKDQLCATLLTFSTKMKYFQANLNQVPLLSSVHPVGTFGSKINCSKEFSGVFIFLLMELM